MTPLRQRMLEDLQIRHYSPTTTRLYLHSVAEFAKHFRKSPDQLGPEHIRQYQLFLKQKQAGQSTCVQLVCALRFLYTHTLNRKIEIERIPFPRRERKLPLILSREEVKALLQAPGKLRDRAVLGVLYSSGLRVSEATQLKSCDIDAHRKVIWVRQGKGRRDRQTLLSAKLLEFLREYWRAERPGEWLFPATDRTRPIAPKTIYLACRHAAQAAGIRPRPLEISPTPRDFHIPTARLRDYCSFFPNPKTKKGSRPLLGLRLILFQDHLVLETEPSFRIILGLENARRCRACFPATLRLRWLARLLQRKRVSI